MKTISKEVKIFIIAFIVCIVATIIGIAVSTHSDKGQTSNNDYESYEDKDLDTSDYENDEDTTDQEDEDNANAIMPGSYKVGTDLDPGLYIIFGSGYMEVSKDSSGTLDSIISNDNFENNTYVELKVGNYFKFNSGEMYNTADPNAPTLDIDKILGNINHTVLRVGVDITAGEYKLIATDYSAYMAVCKGATGSLYSIIANDNFENSRYVTVRNGQFLFLKGCTINLIK